MRKFKFCVIVSDEIWEGRGGEGGGQGRGAREGAREGSCEYNF